MNTDKSLYGAMSFGLQKTKDECDRMGCGDWLFTMVVRHPTNPKSYIVIGTTGDEPFQQKIGALINPDDVDKDSIYIAKPS